MKVNAGPNVSTQETGICIVDADGIVLSEKSVAPDGLLARSSVAQPAHSEALGK